MSNFNETMPVRNIQNERPFDAKRFFLQWEWLLVIVFIGINIVNTSLSPNYFVFDNIMSAIQMFSDKAILVFPMMMIILLGEIDISIASTMALTAVLMGVSYQAGAPMPLAILIALASGTLCGFINGFILTKFKELSSMIVTLSTMIIYRGIASIILEDSAVGNFPKWLQFLGWQSIAKIPVIFWFFIFETIIFFYIIHFTKFGRSLYAIGNNEVTSRYSGIKTDQVKLIVFTVMGLFAAISAIFLTSKMGSVRPSMARGYELDVIAMVVLGGVSNNGGKGRVIGVLIATFIIGLLRYGLGIINVPAQTILVIIGVLLIVSVAIPNFKSSFNFKAFKK